MEWRCDEKGVSTDPTGVWAIVVTYPSDGTLLVQKDSALVRIPASDVKRIANYDLEKVFQKVDDINNKYLKPKKDTQDVD